MTDGPVSWTLDALAVLDSTRTPVLDLMDRLNAASLDASTLDARTLMLVRIAALVAVDAPRESYRANLGIAVDLDIDLDTIRGLLAAVAPIVGTARVVSATTRMLRAFEPLDPTSSPI